MSAFADRTTEKEFVMATEQEVEEWRRVWHAYIDKVADDLLGLLVVVASDPRKEERDEATNVRDVR